MKFWTKLKKAPKKIIYPILSTAILAAIFLLGLNIINSQKIILGVEIAGEDYGGKTENEAFILLQEQIGQFEKQKITFAARENKFSKGISSDNLGITIDGNETLKTALSIGRGLNTGVGTLYELKTLILKKEAPVIYKIQGEKFNNFFARKIASQIENPAKNATLVYNRQKQNFDIMPAKTGKIIDRQKMINDLDWKISRLDPGPVNLSLVEDIPTVEAEETGEAKNRALEILAKTPYALKHEDKRFTIGKEEILSFLEFKPKVVDLSGNKILGVRLNYDSAKDYITELAPGINEDPVSAQFKIENGKVAAFALSSPGKKINIERTTQNLIQNIWNGVRETEITADSIAPRITENDVENLGITNLIGRGTSNFSGSPPNRIHNIKVGIEKFQGVLIVPDEEFSFGQTLGEIGPQTGYLPELTIKKDKTVPEYGGGLCQVSTTMFRAAVNAGLEIIERFPHAYPVKYYGPQGFDATIYPPSPDLKFKNNTGNHLLVQTKIEGSSLIFELYGKDDGRKVVLDGPYEYDKKPDGSMRAKLTQKVYDKDGDLLLEKTFYSNYKSPSLYPVDRNPLE